MNKQNQFVVRASLAAAGLGLALAASAAPVTYTFYTSHVNDYPDSQVALGTQVFTAGKYSLTLSFTGDTKDVCLYKKTAANGHVTTGYRIDKGVAKVSIHNLVSGARTDATFAPGEVYVGSDISNGGIGFGSRIYPIYPYALLTNGVADLALPAYNLTKDFQLNYYAISCVNYAKGNGCSNVSPNALNYPLKTDKGNFWVTAQGITTSVFYMKVVAPLPPATVPAPRKICPAF
jgi:hypothetical protein